MTRKLLEGKNVLIMGLGRFGGGVDAAKFAAARGANVTVTDLAKEDELRNSLEQLKEYKTIEYHLGTHKEEDFQKSDIVIVNPAVPANNKFIRIARENHKRVTSQIAIFFEQCPAKIIGITGANGKSTTTTMTAHLLRTMENKNYGKVWLSGNIGNEPLLMLLDEIRADDLVVLELSSFQIEQLEEIKKGPAVALITNLLPNHLDRYGTFERYCRAKKTLFDNQDDDAVSIFNGEDEICRRWYEEYKKAANRKCLCYGADDVNKNIREKLRLPGRYNISNLAGATAIAHLFGVGDETIESRIGQFEGLAHRLEFVVARDGLRWFNDSKATTAEATMAALDSFEEPTVLIAGGYDKNLPFDKLAEKIAKKCRAVVLIGATAEKLETAVRTVKKDMVIETAGTLAEAVEKAKNKAKSGDVVVLSPACASYDMFENYEQRGNEFIRLVRL